METCAVKFCSTPTRLIPLIPVQFVCCNGTQFAPKVTGKLLHFSFQNNSWTCFYVECWVVFQPGMLPEKDTQHLLCIDSRVMSLVFGEQSVWISWWLTAGSGVLHAQRLVSQPVWKEYSAPPACVKVGAIQLFQRLNSSPVWVSSELCLFSAHWTTAGNGSMYPLQPCSHCQWSW